MLGSCCARKPRTAPSQRKHQGARCAATWAGTNIFAYVIVVLGHVCYCCLRPCMLFLFWAPFHIVGFGIVVLVRVCFCCLRSCLLLLLSFSEEKPRSKVHCIWSKIYVRIFCAGKRRGTARCQSPRSTSRSTAGSNCQNRIPPIPLHSTYPCLYLWQRQCVDKCIYTIVQHICQGGGLLELSGTVKTWPWHWVDGRAPLIKQATPNYFLQENSWTGRPSQ